MRVGYMEVAIIIGILVLLFGATKIPNIARSLGRAKGEFKKGLAEGNAAEKEGGKLEAEKTKES